MLDTIALGPNVKEMLGVRRTSDTEVAIKIQNTGGLPFEKVVTLPQLKSDFRREWNQSDFFIAPTQLNCDGDVDGKIIGTVERLGDVVAYIKDLRALNPPETAARR